MAQNSDFSAVWPEQKTPKSGAFRKAMWAGFGLAAGAATWVVLPASSFQAKSIVFVTDATSPVSMILAQTAAEVALSKPIMTRAAESLIGTGFPAPEPDLAERAGLAANLGGVKATGKTARLAAQMPRFVTARAGETPGSLDIVGSSDDAERASQVASAIADALIANQDDRIASGRRKRELDLAARLDRLKADASAAHQRLLQLGGVEADPLQTLAAAASQTARAQARVNMIHAIIASASPPLSDRRDVPSAIEALQTTYLDLSRQLAKARETLGDRHTTIIALSAELRHASASLTAEWRRLERMAQAELSAAHDREVSLRKVDTGPDAARRESVEAARRSAQFADDNLARALAATRDVAADERGYRLLLHPVVPGMSTGFALWARALLSGLAALSMLGVGLIAERRRRAVGRPVSAGEQDASRPVVVEFADSAPAVRSVTMEDERLVHAQQPIRNRRDPAVASAENASVETRDADAVLKQAMIELMPQIELLEPAFGPLPTVMVAANEATADTTSAALALSRVAAGRGHRVLLIEATRSRPKLAAAVETDADPILIDFFGTLRVALPASDDTDTLFLAPNLQQGARFASALARAGEAPLVDDLGAEFDLVVIDGGRAADAVAAGWGADAYLRAGRFRSKRDDDLFAIALGASATDILGFIADSTRDKRAETSASSTARVAKPTPRPVHRTASQAAASAAPMRQVRQRRKIGTR